MADAEYLRQQADLCRRWARLVQNGRLRLRLFELAVYFDTAADEADAKPARRTRHDESAT